MEGQRLQLFRGVVADNGTKRKPNNVHGLRFAANPFSPPRNNGGIQNAATITTMTNERGTPARNCSPDSAGDASAEVVIRMPVAGRCTASPVARTKKRPTLSPNREEEGVVLTRKREKKAGRKRGVDGNDDVGDVSADDDAVGVGIRGLGVGVRRAKGGNIEEEK